MVYCYCNYGGVDITGWHHLVSSATAWGKLEFSKRAGSVDYFRCRCSGWSGRNPIGFSEIVPVKPSNTEPMIWYHGCAAIFNQAIPPYQAESPLLASNMFCTYNYCCLNGLVNSFHFFDCFGVTLSFLRMPYLLIFLFIRPLTHQLFNFLSYIILIRSIFPKNTSNHVQTGWKKLQVLRSYFLSPWASISISASKNLWDMYVRPISSMSGRCRKTPLTVILKDVMAPAECYVSRSLWGADSWPLLCSSKLENCWGFFFGGNLWGWENRFKHI